MKSCLTAISLLFVATTLGCGAARAPLRASMAPMKVTQPRPAPLLANHFKQDKMGNVTEADMRRILSAPVYLEEASRIGVVPVSSGYGLDTGLPVEAVTGQLAGDLASSGFFEVVSEVTTDWPGTPHSIGGLRELATRYRAEYLLLYRHRFVDREWTNAWGWAYMTAVGAFFVPSKTLEAAGVLEATLFDVKTGTLLFTVYERVHQAEDSNLWHNEMKARRMKETLLEKATDKLTAKVLSKVRSLVAARPEPKKDEAVAQASVGTPTQVVLQADPR
jgi:hypothetical protein